MIPFWWLLLPMPSRQFIETYAIFASGSRLNQVKSKGLWLGSWCGRVDTPVRYPGPIPTLPERLSVSPPPLVDLV